MSISREATEGGATNILNLSFRSQYPDDCAIVLKAVVGSYSEFWGDTYRNVSADTFKLITDVKGQLEKGIALKEAGIEQVSARAPHFAEGQ